MSPPNHLHLNPFLSSYPPQPQSPPSLVSSPPNYQHELIVASDGWHSAPELPLSHHHPIIVVVEACVVLHITLLPLAIIASHRHAASSCHPSLSSCRLLPSLCRIVMTPVAVIVLPVALLPLAVVVLPVTIVMPYHCAAHRRRHATPSCRPLP